MQKLLLGGILVVWVAFVLSQLVPVDRNNPPVESDIPTPPEVKAILRRACYDCHSNETVWPWYSRIAPVSWWVVKDVRDGREELNFSTWDRYRIDERVENLKESWEEVAEEEMPPWLYTLRQRDARLSAHDRALLRQWSLAGQGTHAEEETHAAEPRH